MANKNELTLADAIVAEATATPTAGTARQRTRGMMAKEQQMITSRPLDPVDSLPSFVREHLDAIRESRPNSSERLKSVSDGSDMFDAQLSRNEMGQLGGTETDYMEGMELGITKPKYKPGQKPHPDYKLNLPEEVKKDKAFMSKVDTLASKHGIDSVELLKAIQFETAGSWDPAQKSGTSSATGLIQFMPDTAKGLGTSTKALAKMSRADQMEYVDKYLSRFEGKIKDFDDLYMAIHWPAAVGQSDDYVMYSKGSKQYRANKGLDIDNDGTVTRGEAVYRARS